MGIVKTVTKSNKSQKPISPVYWVFSFSILDRSVRLGFSLEIRWKNKKSGKYKILNSDSVLCYRLMPSLCYYFAEHLLNGVERHMHNQHFTPLIARPGGVKLLRGQRKAFAPPALRAEAASEAAEAVADSNR